MTDRPLATDLATDELGFEREMLLTDSCATAKAAAARDARTCRDCGTGFDACVCNTGMRGDPFRAVPADEEWRPVVGFEGIYEVSNCGRMRSLHKRFNGRGGKLMNLRGRCHGYVRVNLRNACRTITAGVHRLVVEAFILGRAMRGEECADHINGVPSDNRLQNLRVCTQTQNKQYRRRVSGSPHKGVKAVTGSRTFAATIQANGQRLHLGTFATRSEAAAAYDEAAKRLHGDFALTNADEDARRTTSGEVGDPWRKAVSRG